MKITVQQLLWRAKLKLQDQRGLGLVESLIAVAILGVVIVTFVVALSVGSITVQAQDEQVVAQRLARTQLEYIKGYPYNVSTYPAIDAPAGYAISVSVNSSIYADSDIQKITVTISKDSEELLAVEDYKVNR